jgi:hypothetical protein
MNRISPGLDVPFRSSTPLCSASIAGCRALRRHDTAGWALEQGSTRVWSQRMPRASPQGATQVASPRRWIEQRPCWSEEEKQQTVYAEKGRENLMVVADRRLPHK